MTITVVTRPPGNLQWPRSKLSAPLSSVWPVTVTSRLSPRGPTGLCHPMPTAQGPSRPLPRTPLRGSARWPQLYAPVGTVGCSANPVASMQRAVRGLEAAARSEGNGSGLHQAHVPHTRWGPLSKHCPNPTAPRPLAAAAGLARVGDAGSSGPTLISTHHNRGPNPTPAGSSHIRPAQAAPGGV